MATFLSQKRLIAEKNTELRSTLIQLSERFMEIFHFDAIAYSRFYFNGKRLFTCSDLLFSAEAGELGIDVETEALIDLYKRFKLVAMQQIYTQPWSEKPVNPHLKLAKKLGYTHGFNFYIHKENYITAFHLATFSSDPVLHEAYWNNMSVIHDFIYFLDKKLEKFPEVQLYSYDIKQIMEAENLPFPPPYSPQIDQHVLDLMHQSFTEDHSIKKEVLFNLSPQLSKREKECLHLLAHGYSTKEIARELKLSPRTVETHLHHTKAKMHSKNKSDLIKLFHSTKNPTDHPT